MTIAPSAPYTTASLSEPMWREWLVTYAPKPRRTPTRRMTKEQRRDAWNASRRDR